MTTEQSDPSDLFSAAYAGRPELVRELLAAGADVNGRAKPPHKWTSTASEPTALNCALMAWPNSESVFETVQVLLSAGAVVDKTHFDDLAAGSPGGDAGLRVLRLIEYYAAQQQRAKS